MPGKTFRQKLRSKNNKQSKKNHSNNKKSRKQLKGGMKVRVPITRITSQLSNQQIAGLTTDEWNEYRHKMLHIIQKEKANEKEKKKRDEEARNAHTEWIHREDIAIENAEARNKAKKERLEKERHNEKTLRLHEAIDAQSRADNLAQSRSTARRDTDIQNRIHNILGIQIEYILDMAEPRYLNKDEMIRRLPATEIYKDMLDKKFTDEKNKIIGGRSLYDTGVLDEVEVRFKEYLDSEYKKRDEYTDMYSLISRREGARISDERVAAQTARHLGRGGSQ
jgi:hypothetical protein